MGVLSISFTLPASLSVTGAKREIENLSRVKNTERFFLPVSYGQGFWRTQGHCYAYDNRKLVLGYLSSSWPVYEGPISNHCFAEKHKKFCRNFKVNKSHKLLRYLRQDVRRMWGIIGVNQIIVYLVGHQRLIGTSHWKLILFGEACFKIEKS